MSYHPMLYGQREFAFAISQSISQLKRLRDQLPDFPEPQHIGRRVVWSHEQVTAVAERLMAGAAIKIDATK